MSKYNTVEENIKLLDESIQREMQEIFNINHKAKNFQKLAYEKVLDMAKIYEKLLPCKPRLNDLFFSIEVFMQVRYISL